MLAVADVPLMRVRHVPLCLALWLLGVANCGKSGSRPDAAGPDGRLDVSADNLRDVAAGDLFEGIRTDLLDGAQPGDGAGGGLDRTPSNLDSASVDSGGDVGSIACAWEWPAGPSSAPLPRASLGVTAPSILWRQPSINGVTGGESGGEGGGLVVSGRNFVATSSNGVYFIDRNGVGTRAAGYRSAFNDIPSSPTADTSGAVYFAGPSGTYGLMPDGTRKWYQPEGAIPVGEGASGPNIGTSLALDPDGILYGVSADLQVRAFRAKDGSVLWKHALGQLRYPTFANQSGVLGGAGNVLFVRPGSEATIMLDKRDGSELGRLMLPDGTDTVAGWTTNFALGYGRTIFEGLWFFDVCGNALLPGGIPTETSSTRIDNYLAGTLDFAGNYAVYLFATDARYNTIANTGRLSLYDPTGNRARGPTAGKGQPIAVGADGVLYTLSCYGTNPLENRLYAYDSSLKELWHLDLGKPQWCPKGYGVLDADGVLYLPISNETVGGDDVMAIQTGSPGLATSAWPMTRHDPRGTMWLTAADSERDGGTPDRDGALDVPLSP